MEQPHMKILIFSWNHQAVRIGEMERCSQEEEENFEEVVSATITWSLSKIYESYPPDFFPEWEKIIMESEADVVVFGSQEDAIPGSYFHSDFLPKKMADLYYNLQKRTRLMSLGIETYKAIKTFDFKLRGLRLSVYAKPYLTGMIELEERGMRDILGEKGQLWANCSFPFLQSKGAIASYLKIPGIGLIAFICSHLPFDAESIKEAYNTQNTKIRENALVKSNLSFNYLLQELVFNVRLDIDREPLDVGHVFFFGDLNYRVFSLEKGMEDQFLKNNKNTFQKIWKENDELHQELEKGHILLDFQEGIDNQGPLFLPTCKMKKPRKTIDEAVYIADIFNTGQGQRKPSWCDRILYCDRAKNKSKTRCMGYNRLDSGKTMKKSDHAAIYGLYIIESN